MGLAQHIVVGVVGWCHLQAARSKLNVHIAVLDDGNHTAHQWHNHLAALQPLVLRVLGIDAHGSIAHDGLRTSGGNNSIIALGILVDDVTLSLQSLLVLEDSEVMHIILQMEEMAFLFLINHLLGGESRQCLRIPVHHAQATIDESLAIEVNKNFDHAL